MRDDINFIFMMLVPPWIWLLLAIAAAQAIIQKYREKP